MILYRNVNNNDHLKLQKIIFNNPFQEKRINEPEYQINLTGITSNVNKNNF